MSEFDWSKDLYGSFTDTKFRQMIVQAVFNLHERLERMERGRPTAAWVRDLEERVIALEESPSIRRDNIRQAAIDNERRHYDDLQARVDEFVKWVRPTQGPSVPVSRHPGYHRRNDEIFAKLRELGLVREGRESKED